MKKIICFLIVISMFLVTMFTYAAVSFKQEIKIPVLMYHGVLESPTNPYEVSVIDFTYQMQYLKDNGYEALSLDKYDAIMDEKTIPTTKYVLITFDDGCKSAYLNAIPVLKSLNFTATFFISTGLLNTSGYMEYMTDEQVKLLAKEKFDIANHTVNHEWLSWYSYREQTNIIRKSNTRLKELTGRTIKYISYPYGDFDYNTVSVLDRLNMRCGFTCLEGLSSSFENPYAIRRQFVERDMKLNKFIKLLN